MDTEKESSESSPRTEPESVPKPPDETIVHTPSVASYSISPRRVATISMAVSAGSLTALAVVSSVEGADTLSTIALVLAIIAFTIQILLFVVQTQATNEQRVRSEQLNTQTRTLLAEVRTTAQATQALVSERFSQLLQTFVTGAARTAEETKFDPATFEQRLLTNIRNEVRGPLTAAQLSQASTSRETRRRSAAAGRPPQSSSEQRRVLARDARPSRLTSFPPDEEGQAVVQRLETINTEGRRRLAELGADELDSWKAGTYVGLSPEPVDDELQRLGLVVAARVDQGDGVRIVVTRLTEDGVLLARVFTAVGEIPAWARAIVADEVSGVADDDIPF